MANLIYFSFKNELFALWHFPKENVYRVIAPYENGHKACGKIFIASKQWIVYSPKQFKGDKFKKALQKALKFKVRMHCDSGYHKVLW